MLNGAYKNLSNLVLNFVTYLRDKTLEVVSKPQIRFKSKRHTLINTIRCVIPPTRGRKPMKKRSPASGGMSKYILKRFATQLLGLRWGFETTSKIPR
jgi:hypothetical protein